MTQRHKQASNAAIRRITSPELIPQLLPTSSDDNKPSHALTALLNQSTKNTISSTGAKAKDGGGEGGVAEDGQGVAEEIAEDGKEEGEVKENKREKEKEKKKMTSALRKAVAQTFAIARSCIFVIASFFFIQQSLHTWITLRPPISINNTLVGFKGLRR